MSIWVLRGAAVAVLAVMWWLSRVLAQARWQVAACIPVRQDADGSWQAVNLTWYGIVSAVAYTLAVGTLVFLGVGLGGSMASLLAMVAAVLAVCMPASRLVAAWVEGKRATLTVGGAVFVALWLVPVVAWGVRQYWGGLPPWPQVLAASAVAYALGEGVGRLACCSFGCCYGRRVEELPAPWLRLATPLAVRFWGATKKAAYASGLEGVALVPVQGMATVVHGLAAWMGAEALAAGDVDLALAWAGIVPLAWRVVSEFLRADFRGNARFSAYQWMAVVGMVWIGGILGLVPATEIRFDGSAALGALSHPGTLLALLGVFVVSLAYTGISRVTAACVHLRVRPERI
jgi:hypothetical protein